MIAAALDPIPRANGISLSITIRNAGSGLFLCLATLFETRKIKLSGVVGIRWASKPRGMISQLRPSPCPSFRLRPIGLALRVPVGVGNVSTVTRKYFCKAKLSASKPAPKLDVLAGTRNEKARLMTNLTSLRRFSREGADLSRSQIAGPYPKRYRQPTFRSAITRCLRFLPREL